VVVVVLISCCGCPPARARPGVSVLTAEPQVVKRRHIWLVDRTAVPGRLEINFQSDVEAFERRDARRDAVLACCCSPEATFTAWQTVGTTQALRTLNRRMAAPASGRCGTGLTGPSSVPAG
jgi:hypothetical protein